ncbi:MAG TPA: SGNH/GDSL hydrolase family protein [Tepidisphaeraceae bacterium]|nr:SGNH/GDSL hydrolase family protein [Tepidisphaeraceae bacterium]
MTFSDGTLRMLALGDSYTIGESVEAEHRWPVQLSRRLRERGVMIGDVAIIARTGWTTGELHAAIDAQKPAGPFDYVTLLIGVNDQYRGGTAEAFRAAFASVLERAVALAGGDSGRVIVVSIPDWGVMPFAEGRDREIIAQQIDAFNEVCRSTAVTRLVTFVDLTAISRRAATQPALVAEDGLHPSAAQYALWARAIDEVMAR